MAVGKRLRRMMKMLDDVVNAVFHVGDAAHCDVRGRKGRHRGTRAGRHAGSSAEERRVIRQQQAATYEGEGRGKGASGCFSQQEVAPGSHLPG